MNVVLVGPPGVGKGTQGKVLSDRLQVEHVAAGDLLRAEVAAKSEIGRAVSSYLEQGRLVPDSVMLDLIMPVVVSAAQSGGYLLDGFPRTIDQVELAGEWRVPGQGDEVAAPDAVIVLQADEDVLVERALARGRKDDTEDVVRHRLRLYADETTPVVEWFRGRGVVHTIDGTMSVEQVSDAILAELDVPRA